jgi:hypothetical protein
MATTGATVAFGLALGAVAVLTWEHASPLGLARKVARLDERREALAGDLRACSTARTALFAESWGWEAAYKRLEAARQDDAKAAAAAAAARADEQARQCRAAYQSGVTAGRALGPRGSNDPNPSPAPGVAGPDGLRDDLAASWRSGAVGAPAGR